MLRRLSGAAACGLLTAVGTAHALGLGDIKVSSGLNQRFTAVIPFTSLSPEEAANVRARIAENQDFARAGVERSTYLSSIQVEAISEGPNPRIELRSREIAREPMLSLLVEVRTPGGPRVLREYTVLLDPPVSSAPSVAPAARAESLPESAGASEFFQTAEEASGRRSTPDFADAAPAQMPDSYGPIRAGETLRMAAQSIKTPDIGLEQAMLALYEANPSAFSNGQIDALRKGAVLAVPDAARMKSRSNAAARTRIASLKPPAPVAPAAEIAAAPVTPAPAVPAPVTPSPSVPAPVAEAPVPADPAPSAPLTPPAGESAASPAPSDTPLAPAAPAGEAPPAAPATGAVDPASPPSGVAPAVAPPAAAASESGGWIDYLIPALIGLILVLIGVAVWRTARERRAQREYEEASRATSDLPPPRAGAGGTIGAKAATSARDELEAIDRAIADDDATRMDVATSARLDEDRTRMVTTSRIPAYTGPQAADRKMDAAELAVTTQFQANTKEINLGDNDPLSEADFHLAYGLYDEAALLLQQASARDPKRPELRVKLAETYFSAGRAAEFEQTAASLKDEVSADEWSKLAIMGRQIVPASALFPGAASSTSDDTILDLSFDDDDATQIAPVKGSEGLEFNLEELELPTQATAAAPTAAAPSASLEFDLGEFDLGGTAPAKTPELRTTELSLEDFDLGGAAVPASGKNDLEFKLEEVEPLLLDDGLGGDDLSVPSGNDAATKLDLARAYVEMGDAEMARSLLDEVAQLGNGDQKREAGELRARLLG